MSAVLSRDGLRLALHDQGGAGRPFLFQHGLGGSAEQTFGLAGGCAGLRLVTLECRGHGASEAGDPAAFSIATFADDVVAVADHLFDRPVVVGGVSMGAAIALRLAVRRPDLVRALVLVRPAWVVEAGPPNMAPNAEVGRLLAAHPADAARALFEAGDTARHLAEEAPDNLASLLGFFAREPIAVTSALLIRISADGPGVTDAEVRTLGVPTLVIANDRDAIHPLAHAERLAASIPAPRLHVVPPKSDDRDAHTAAVGAAIEAFVLTTSEPAP